MDEKVVFEFAEQFDIVKLEKCRTDEEICSRVFLCRQGDLYFSWKFSLIPKCRTGDKEAFGFSLRLFGNPGCLSVDGDLFVGDKHICRGLNNARFDQRHDNWGSTVFLPSVASLRDRNLVINGAVKFGVRIVLNASYFDPIHWLPTATLTPDPGLLARQLFANLGTENHFGTDFVIVVEKFAARKRLHVNRLALTVAPFFERMFADGESKENQRGVLYLPNYSADVVIETLRSVYLNEVGADLTRFLPSLLSLASEWELKSLMTEIERAMIVKLQDDPFNFDLAADYYEFAFPHDTKIARRVAECILMDNWPQFLITRKGKGKYEQLRDYLSLMMSAAAVYKGVFTGLNSDPLSSLPLTLRSESNRTMRQLFANLGTADRRGTDFVIAVGEADDQVELHVYRLALDVVPFFNRMFDNDEWKENQEGVLHLPTHTVDAVVEVLRFLYLNEIDVNLTRFLPSLLSLASEWELDDLMVAIERDMVKKLMDDRFGYGHDTAAEYFELAEKYNRKVVGGVAIRKLIEAWPEFIHSSKGKDMDEQLKDKLTCVMAAIASGAPIDDGE